MIEFTDRGPGAWRAFTALAEEAARHDPESILGAGSIRDPEAADRFIASGARFIVGPSFSADVARLCNRRRIPYLPGCATPTEIVAAEEWGVELVKVFPGDSLGPGFLKAIRGPLPDTQVVVTGGVQATEASVGEWIDAGAACLGIRLGPRRQGVHGPDLRCRPRRTDACRRQPHRPRRRRPRGRRAAARITRKELQLVTSAITARDYENLIDGRWVAAADGDTFERISPAHDVAVGRYPRAGVEDLDRAVAAARRAFDEGPWPTMPGVERARILNRVAEAIRADADDLAYVEALESGKPVTQARDEIVSSADLWEYASTLCRHTYGDTYNTLGGSMLGLVLREPVGVVGMITPWNFPLLIISQKLPFALAVGCTAVVKPAEITPGTTLRLARMAQEAGLPDGVLNVVTGSGSVIGTPLAAHPDVDMISFTGSTDVGRRVIDASKGNLKKVELELGGKNPQLVFADADLDAALDAVVYGVYFNMGECCNSGSRLLVQRSIADEFVDAVVERSRAVPVGDPLDPKTKVGAIATDEQLDKIVELVASGRAEGADLLLGGGRLETERGRFMAPTVFSRVASTMRIAREEIFGPVLSVLTFDTPEEAARIANATPFGLSAGVWTRDLDTAIGMSRAIRAGTIWVNTFLDGYPELPFGGYKESGIGREFGRFSLDAFTELKSVQMHLGPRTSWWMPRPGATAR